MADSSRRCRIPPPDRPSRSRAPSLAACALLLVSGLGVLVPAGCSGREAAAAAPDLDRLAARRDSLLQEMEHYHAQIAELRDSLRQGELDSRDERAMDRAMKELSLAIGQLGKELGDLEFEIGDQQISLRDRSGGGRIRIDIPPDLGDRISQGLTGITTAILEDIPDSVVVRVPGEKGSTTHSLSIQLPSPARPPRPPRLKRAPHVRGGDLVRIAQDVYVQQDEEVRGDVVAVLGNVLIEGRVTGDVVAVLGDVQVADGAEIGGNLVVVGRLDQDPDAKVRGNVVSVGGPLGPRGVGLDGVLRAGWVAFLVGQVGFVLVALVTLLAIGLVPRPRLEATVGALVARPAASLGLGLGAAVVGNLVVTVLVAVLVLTVIGIPLALLLLLAWAVAGALGIATAAVQTGRLLLRRSEAGRPWLSAVVGLVVLHLVSFLAATLGLVAPGGALAVLLTILGLSIEVMAWVVGLGALAASRFGRREPGGEAVSAFAGGTTGSPA